MRGTGKIFVKPKLQAMVVLPAAVMAVVSALAGYVLLAVTRYAGYNALQGVGADERIVQVFLADTLIFTIIFVGVSAAILIGSVLWAGWISLRVFGPISRLERGLNGVLNGETKPLSVTVRQSDLLYDLFQLFDRVLSRR